MQPWPLGFLRLGLRINGQRGAATAGRAGPCAAPAGRQDATAAPYPVALAISQYGMPVQSYGSDKIAQIVTFGALIWGRSLF